MAEILGLFSMDKGRLMKDNTFEKLLPRKELRSKTGTSPAVQWLRLCLALPMQGMRVQSLVRELRSHMPHRQKTKT